MILKIALMSYSFIPSKCFLPGGQLNFQSGEVFILFEGNDCLWNLRL